MISADELGHAIHARNFVRLFRPRTQSPRDAGIHVHRRLVARQPLDDRRCARFPRVESSIHHAAERTAHIEFAALMRAPIAERGNDPGVARRELAEQRRCFGDGARLAPRQRGRRQRQRIHRRTVDLPHAPRPRAVQTTDEEKLASVDRAFDATARAKAERLGERKARVAALRRRDVLGDGRDDTEAGRVVGRARRLVDQPGDAMRAHARGHGFGVALINVEHEQRHGRNVFQCALALAERVR
ncbi:MAG TPA: hypothetical protein VHC69_21115 [Polyangiaceae bacterium]|nr:hypothetical protein [Polyangiaceae bacterium]